MFPFLVHIYSSDLSVTRVQHVLTDFAAGSPDLVVRDVPNPSKPGLVLREKLPPDAPVRCIAAYVWAAHPWAMVEWLEGISRVLQTDECASCEVVFGEEQIPSLSPSDLACFRFDWALVVGLPKLEAAWLRAWIDATGKSFGQTGNRIFFNTGTFRRLAEARDVFSDPLEIDSTIPDPPDVLKAWLAALDQRGARIEETTHSWWLKGASLAPQRLDALARRWAPLDLLPTQPLLHMALFALPLRAWGIESVASSLAHPSDFVLSALDHALSRPPDDDPSPEWTQLALTGFLRFVGDEWEVLLRWLPEGVVLYTYRPGLEAESPASAFELACVARAFHALGAEQAAGFQAWRDIPFWDASDERVVFSAHEPSDRCVEGLFVHVDDEEDLEP